MHKFIDLNAVQKLFGITIALVLIIAGILLAVSFRSERGQNEPIACTMEAKLCPDGSAVGRMGPKCEFAPCPSGGQFTTEGNIVRNNPGLKPDTWYLVYESAGAPALTTELIFDAESECVSEGRTISCALTTFPQGTRAHIVGTTAGDGIIVRTLTQI